MNTINLLSDFETACVTHDWSYGYSDDYSVFKRGEIQMSKIQHLFQVIKRTGDQEMLVKAKEIVARFQQ